MTPLSSILERPKSLIMILLSGSGLDKKQRVINQSINQSINQLYRRFNRPLTSSKYFNFHQKYQNVLSLDKSIIKISIQIFLPFPALPFQITCFNDCIIFSQYSIRSSMFLFLFLFLTFYTFL